MGLLSWIVVGLLAGMIAGAITGTRAGCLSKIAVGVIGAFIGGSLAHAAGKSGIGHFGLRSVLLAAVGAILLELVLQALSGRRRSRRF